MANEKRARTSRLYVYQSRKTEGGKVKKTYLGRASDQGVEVLVRQRKLMLKQQAEALALDKKIKLAADEVILFLNEHWIASDMVLTAITRLRNYTSRIGEIEMPETIPLRVPQLTDVTLDEFEAVVRRAQTGQPEAIERLKIVLADNSQIWQVVGDLAALSRRRLLELAFADDVLLEESNTLKLQAMTEQLKEEICGQFPPLVEQLLLDRLINSHLAVHFFEIQATQQRSSRMIQAFWSKQLSQAQKRYEESLMALRKVSGDQHDHDPKSARVDPSKPR
jgi:hypothetical protein